MMPTKTASQIINELKQYWNAKPFNKAEYLQKEKQKWVAVDVLQQKLQEILESLQKYVALNPDGSIGEHPNKTFLRTENIVRELLVELELEEAKKQ